MEKARINTNKVDRRRARLQAIQEKKAELKKQVFFDPTMDSTFKKIFKKIANLIHFLNAILHLEGNQQIVHVEKLKPTVRLAAPAKKPKIIRTLCLLYIPSGFAVSTWIFATVTAMI